MRRLNVVNRKHALKAVKEIDAFPKVPENYKEQTVTGAGVSIIAFIFITVLVVSEVKYYSDSELQYSYDVDGDFDSKLPINIDITVAMQCNEIGADILDMTGQNADTFGKLNEEPVQFELTQDQAAYLKMIQQVNDYIKNEYHAVHDFLWKSGFTSMQTAMPKRKKEQMTKLDGCRFHGVLEVNKVAGNFHITAGKSINFPGAGHAHLALSMNNALNFSHRIDHFSFGKPTPGVVNPLDGDFRITDDRNHMFQYFIQVVPANVNTRHAEMDTYQFAVTERNRSINHNAGSHGVPGIFVKYDLAPLKISVREVHKPYWQFLVRLCGIVGGVFATSGLLHNLAAYIYDAVCCRLKLGKYKNSVMQPGLVGNAVYPNPLEESPKHSTDNDLNGPKLQSTSLLTDMDKTSWQTSTLLSEPTTQ